MKTKLAPFLVLGFTLLISYAALAQYEGRSYDGHEMITSTSDIDLASTTAYTLTLTTRSATPRWRIAGPPASPTNPDGDTLFSSWTTSNFQETWSIGRWDPVESQYEKIKGLTDAGVNNPATPASADYFLPGTGWWLAKKGDGETFDFTLYGDQLTSDTTGGYTHSITVYEGWNMIANPFDFNRYWNTTGITVSFTKDTSPYTDEVLGSANANLCTNGKIYWYDGANDNYPDGISYDAGHIMGQWYGYWIKIETGVTDATLKITSVKTTDAASVYPATTPLDWQIDITASAESGIPSQITAGISEQAEPAADLLDDRQPPPPPIEQPVKIGFDHLDWQKWPGKYRRDIRPIANSLVFPMCVSTKEIGKKIKLELDLSAIPEGYRVWLYDKANDQVILQTAKTDTLQSRQFSSTAENTAFDLVVSNLSDGDMNGDEKISSSDAAAVLHAVVGASLQTDQRVLGDVSGDGTISAYDAAVILQKVAGMVE